MNSLLQCLYYIQDLRDYFIKEKDNFKADKPVCKALSDVMYGLKYNKENFFEATKFKEIMGDKNSLFYGEKAGDAKDLFFNLIDSLYSELVDDDKTDYYEEDNIDPFNKLDLFKRHEHEVDKNIIINKLFIGFYETSYFCEKDKRKITYSFQSESFLLFELEKINKYFKNNSPKNELSLDLCFQYYYRLQKNCSFRCNKCEKIDKNESCEGIYRPPEILVIILDRGHG